jgi:hypothetical protein
MTAYITYRASLSPVLPGATTAKMSPLSNAEADANMKSLANELELKAFINSPTFTGNVVLPTTTVIGNISASELAYIDGATSNIQTQINTKAPLASPVFTGAPTSTTPAQGDSSANIATTAFVQNANSFKANTASPTFTGLASAPQFASTIASGTAPFVVTSTTKVTNLNADLLDGLNSDSAATASTVVTRDSAADVSVRLLRATYTDESTISGAIAYRVNNSTDNYTRYCSSPSAIRNFLGVPSGSGSSTGINTGDQTSVSGNAGTVTNGVYIFGDQTINGNKTFSSPIIGSLSGTATYVSGNQQQSVITGAQNSLNMTAGNSTNLGSFVAKASGAGDGNLAGITFWNDSYAIKMGVRSDGLFGIGGWSRGAWSWYSDASGNTVSAGNMSGYSDPRLKENVVTIADPFNIINAIDGVRFNWNSHSKLVEGKWGKSDYGVLADQVKSVMPEIVTPSIKDEENQEIYDTVDYTRLVPVLLEAIKELKREVDLLKAK